MRILALDSSGLVASVAVVEKIEEEEQVIAEYTVNYKKTHSQTLLPMLDTVSDMIELDLKTIDATQLPADRVHLPGFASAPPQRKVWDLP